VLEEAAFDRQVEDFCVTHLIVVFSSCVSRGRRAWTTVASTI
jgi:hypothetical protein